MAKLVLGKMRLFLTAIFVFIFCLCHVCQCETPNGSVDIGRAKAKISVEEMLKLHRKRRDDDKLFSINSPRKNEQNQVRTFFTQFAHRKIPVCLAFEF